MTPVSVHSLVVLGFVIGLRQATEADHLAAISTIVTERRSLLSSLVVGGLWGFGHTLALLIAGVCILVLRYQMTDRMTPSSCASASCSFSSAPTCCALWHAAARAIHTITRPSQFIHTVTRGSLRDRSSSGSSTDWPAARPCCCLH